MGTKVRAEKPHVWRLKARELFFFSPLDSDCDGEFMLLLLR